MKEAKSRRDFLGSLFETKTRKVTAGLEVYNKPLSLADAYHLLRRTCIVLDHNYAKSLVGKTAEAAVDEIIANTNASPSPSPPPFWNNAFPDPRLDPNGASSNDGKWRSENYELQLWWINLIQKDTKSLVERLALLWHGHFTTKYNICNLIPAQLMYRQNILFRKNSLGNFKAFLESITLDGAMLMYLNGNDNIKDAPNENFARELLELYSIGVGNYTEEDIREAARVLTGWKVNQFINEEKVYEPFLRTGYFDLKDKVVFGSTFKVDYEVNDSNVRKNSINKLVEVIITKKSNELSRYITSKLYRQFVYSKSDINDDSVISELAVKFKESNFQVEPLLKSILTSSHFFDAQNVGIQITSPIETIVNFTSHFDTKPETKNNMIKELGLELLNPPNVAGWKGYRSWVTSKTLPLTISFCTQILEEHNEAEVGVWAQQFTGYRDSYRLTEEIASLFFGRLPSEERIDGLMKKLLGGAPYYEWPSLVASTENAGMRIKVLLKEIFKTPEFYLR